MPELEIAPIGARSDGLLGLIVSKRGDATILSPRGELDGAVVEELAPIVRNTAAWGADVVLDLAEVESLNGRAIEGIGSVAAEVQRLEGRWVVAAIEDGEDPVRFNVVATLASKLTTCGDVDEALALLREPVLPGPDGFAEAV